ncbi:MAG: hypothetical protein GY710_21530 [Desulfobacteraceae bacterium]|nr:hypothetical protein [Desulfobacteraceae bacterium]
MKKFFKILFKSIIWFVLIITIAFFLYVFYPLIFSYASKTTIYYSKAAAVSTSIYSNIKYRVEKYLEGDLVFTRVSAGTFFSMALTDDGRLWVTGSNRCGQMGTGKRDDVKAWTSVLSNVVDIAAGEDHALALIKDGRLMVAGSNYDGEIAAGSMKQIFKWKAVLSNVVFIAAGERHSFAVRKDGTLWATGDNSFHQLGVPNYYYRKVVKRDRYGEQYETRVKVWRKRVNKWIRVFTDVEQVYAGTNHSMALRKDGTLWVAGKNEFGQYGDGKNKGSEMWRQVVNNVKSVSTGFSSSSMVIRKSEKEIAAEKQAKIKGKKTVYKQEGDLWVTGWNWNGQLGIIQDEDADEDEDEEAAVDYEDEEFERANQYYWSDVLSNVIHVSSAPNHCFSLTKDGRLYAAGSNGRGQLGTGDFKDRRKWVEVARNVWDVSAGHFHSLMIKRDGTLWVCGDNYEDQLGTDKWYDEEGWVQIKKVSKRKRWYSFWR